MPSVLMNAPDVAHIANQALSAWRDNREIELEWHAGTNAWESEKLEVLQAALECLKAEQNRVRSARLQAAERLLEHLASSHAEPL